MIRERPLVVVNESIRQRLENRSLLFLDLNLWIDVAESEHDEAVHAKRYLLEAVGAGRLACPTSFPLVSELLQQEPDSAARVADVMDRLSLKCCFLPNPLVFYLEVERCLDGLLSEEPAPFEGRDVCGPVYSFLSLGGRLAFPEGFPADRIQRASFTADLGRNLGRKGVRDLVRLLTNSLPLKDIKSRKPKYQEAIRKRDTALGRDARRIRREEVAFVTEKWFIPCLEMYLQRVDSVRKACLLHELGKLRQDRNFSRTEELLKRCPALSAFVNVMVVSGRDPQRRDDMRDFFDREVLILPYAYADAIAARDKWLFHLALQMQESVEGRSPRIFKSLSEMTDFVRFLLDQV